jgi:hypothetical protein
MMIMVNLPCAARTTNYIIHKKCKVKKAKAIVTVVKSMCAFYIVLHVLVKVVGTTLQATKLTT